MKSKSLILMFVSLGFGLIAAIGIGQVMGKGGDTGEKAVEMSPILVAIDLVDMHSDLTEENIKIDHWPTHIVPEDAIRSFEELEGMVNTSRLSKGAPVLTSTVDRRENVGKVPIPDGFKVCAIKVSGDDTINGLLAPGHRIDVIGVFKTREDGENVSVSKTFLKNVEVYSVNASFSNTGQREETASAKSAIVGLLLNERNSEQLVLVQKVAQLKLVLRGNAGPDDDDEDLANIDEELERYINSRSASGGSDSNNVEQNWETPVDRGFKQIVRNGQDMIEYTHRGDGSVVSSEGEPVPFGSATSTGSGTANDPSENPGSSEIDSDLEEDEYLEQ